MKKLLLLIFIFNYWGVYAQKDTLVLSLQKCLQKVEQNSSLQENTELYNQLLNLKFKNLKANYLPDLQLNASATYQSEVISFDLSLPIGFGEIPIPDKDQYSADLSVKQLLWDGGISKAMQKSERIQNNQNLISQDEKIRKIKKQTATFYFQLLKIIVNRQILNKSIEEVNKRIRSARAAVKNGAIAEQELQKLEVEKLKFNQKLISILPVEKAFKSALIILLNDSLITNFKLEIPKIKEQKQHLENRIEFAKLNSALELTKAHSEILKAERMPKIFIFGKGGYGKPGLNLLSNDFNPYFIVGLNANWKIWDFKYKNNQQMLKIQKDIITNQQSNLKNSLWAANTKLEQNLKKFDQLIASDKKIVALQAEILLKSGKQLDKGTISNTEYLSDLYAQTRYRLNLEIHKIEKIEAIANDYLQNGNYQLNEKIKK